MTNRKRDFQTPVGLSDLSFSYHRINQELPNAYQRVEPALLEDPTLIDPGDRLAGLLIFRQVHPKTKQLRLELAVDLPSGESVRRTARYARLLPPKKDKKNAEDPPGSE